MLLTFPQPDGQAGKEGYATLLSASSSKVSKDSISSPSKAADGYLNSGALGFCYFKFLLSQVEMSCSETEFEYAELTLGC